MRVAIIGQQAFGKAVLDAFIEAGATVPGVFVAPDAPGGKPDPLRLAAAEHGLPVFAFQSYGTKEALDTLRGLDADLVVMAYVTQFVPQSFCTLPRHGSIQFHPSLLPLHRGPSAISWAIIEGRKKTGLTIFRPVDGLDEGPVLLQKEVDILPDDTLGSLYFDRIFPLGVAALIETAQAVIAGRAVETIQDESVATYEGWVRDAEARIDWAKPVSHVYDLIRGCNPSPGAWTNWGTTRLYIFDARKTIARGFGMVRGLRPGQVTNMTAQSFTVHARGGFIEVLRCRLGEGKKIGGGEAGLSVRTILGA
jgi:methionyl-tRNA formyltransferase